MGSGHCLNGSSSIGPMGSSHSLSGSSLTGPMGPGHCLSGSSSTGPMVSGYCACLATVPMCLVNRTPGRVEIAVMTDQNMQNVKLNAY